MSMSIGLLLWRLVLMLPFQPKLTKLFYFIQFVHLVTNVVLSLHPGTSSISHITS